MQPRYLIALIGGLLVGAAMSIAFPQKYWRTFIIPLFFFLPTVSFVTLIWWTELGRRNEAFKYFCAAAWSCIAVDALLFTVCAVFRLNYVFTLEPEPSGVGIVSSACGAGLEGVLVFWIPAWVLVGFVGAVLSLTVQDRIITAFYSKVFKPAKHRVELWKVGVCLGVYCFVVATFMA